MLCPVMKSPLPRIIRTAVFMAAVASTAAAQPGGFSRKLLLEQDLSVPGKRGVMALVEFAPGAIAPRHTHPGDELIYVIEGSVSMEIDGQPARVLKAGDTFLVPAGAVHLGRNVGTTAARAVSTFVVDRGQPLATPVK